MDLSCPKCKVSLYSTISATDSDSGKFYQCESCTLRQMKTVTLEM